VAKSKAKTKAWAKKFEAKIMAKRDAEANNNPKLQSNLKSIYYSEKL
jgi:hypothetical protein